MKDARFEMRLPYELKLQLKQIAKDQDISVTQLITQLIEAQLLALKEV